MVWHLNIQDFLDMTPLRLVHGYKRFGRAYYFCRLGNLWFIFRGPNATGFSKCRLLVIVLNSVTSQKTWIFTNTGVRTSDFARFDTWAT